MFNSGNCSVPLVASIDGNGNNNGGWGNDGWGLIWIVLIFAIFGWGNGFGGWGNNGGGMGSTAAAYTDSAIQRGFDNQAIVGKLDGITNGLCDGFYAANNSMLTGFNGINTNIMQTGYGIQQAINADTVANMQNTNALQAQLAQCCCDNKEAISNTNYNDSAQKTPAVRKNVRGMNAPITNNATIIPTGFSSGIVGFSWPDVLQNAVIRCIALLFQEKHFR